MKIAGKTLVTGALIGLTQNVPLLSTAVNWLRGSGSPIFMLHRVLPHGEPCYDPEMVTSTDVFAQFLDWTCERYEVVPLEEFAKRCGQPTNKKHRPCAITFDDGWRDVYLHAFPILRERKLPATVFLPVRFVNTGYRFWQERLWFCLQELERDGDAPSRVKSVARWFPWCPAPGDNEMSFRKVRELLLRRSSSEAEEFVDRLEGAIGRVCHTSERAFMDWNEVRMLRDGGISFGSHTFNHVLLTRLDPDTARREIAESRDELERQLGETVKGFSYPWGGYNPLIRRLVESEGYQFAVTTQEKLVRSQNDPWSLPRVPIGNPILCNGRKSFYKQHLNFYLARRSLGSDERRVISGNGRHPAERLRIAFIIDQIEDWTGGTEQQLWKLATVLDPKHFEVEFYLLYAKGSLSPDHFPWPVHLVHSMLETEPSSINTVFRLAQLLRQQRPHVAQTFFTAATFCGVLAARMAGVPLVVSTRRNAGYWKTFRHRLALLFINHIVDYWQCNSRTVQECLTDTEGVPRDRIEILPNAIKLQEFGMPSAEQRLRARQLLGLAPATPVFVSVANLRPVKNLETLVEAAACVRQFLPTAQFFLIGDGPLRESLEKQIERLDLRGIVHLVGRRSDPRPYLAAADVGLLTSTTEGCSNSLLEYMATGLPAVVSDIPANRELVDGIYFKPGNATDLANKIRGLWNRPELRQQMQREYSRRAGRYDLAAFVKRAQGYYLRLAADLS